MLIDRDVVSFGGGKQQLVDNRRKQPAKQGALPVMETLHQLGQCQTHIVKSRRARHFTGQDKAPGLDKVQPFALTGVQIVRPGGSDICQTGLIGRGQRIQPGAQLPPAGRPLRTLSLQEPGHLS